MSPVAPHTDSGQERARQTAEPGERDEREGFVQQSVCINIGPDQTVGRQKGNGQGKQHQATDN